ncbi:putative vacuolar amino acid transporter YPQ1 isoform X1 [Senna tora]|uniref:Putative vacuolar amino acid transporter YPQ1 isoform X1 n=1 Tax=Senna tora TaxID=362788 RepID=A0A834SPX0_9FABA|nr:putative vacuolar amino acid transporter YPQ1 isoform X1 [Senna tora]
MGVLGSSALCSSNQQCWQWAEKYMGYCLCSGKETISFTLGVASVLAWVVAEIPQIITNYKNKSAEGLSWHFLTTWIIGDLFNLFGCLLEPATSYQNHRELLKYSKQNDTYGPPWEGKTLYDKLFIVSAEWQIRHAVKSKSDDSAVLPTQYYMAVLYTCITVVLVLQSTYYGYIYPRIKWNRLLQQLEALESEQSNGGEAIDSDADKCNGTDVYKGDDGYSSPIPLPSFPQKISAGSELYYQSARYLSKSHTPSAGSILAQKMSPPSSPHMLDSIEEPLLFSKVSAQSAPSLKIKNTLCLVSTITFLGALNLLQSPDRNPNSAVITPRREFVMQVGRKLLQVGGFQTLEHGSEGSNGIGGLLGWGMAILYMGGRIPQIHLNIRRGKVEGLNPFMFIFALVGNSTYVASKSAMAGGRCRMCRP